MDERLANIEKQKQEALQQSNNAYSGLFQNNQNLYNQQNAYAEQYEQTQNDALDKQLAFYEQKIEQQKETAKQNRDTEAKRAKNDYFSYVNPYGVQAESMASGGLLNSGVSETAKLGGYNTYQNRLASANKALQDAITQYDMDMNEARLNNDVQKAQNALKKFEMQVQFAESYYNNNSNLTLQQLQNNQNLDSEYYNRYNTEYNNIQEERAREEAIREWQAQFDYQKQQDALAQQNWEREYALSKTSSSGSRSSGGSVYSLNNNSGELTGNEISSNGLSIAANPYTGTINPDAKNGVFEWSENPGSGYQPNNIGGVKLKKSGSTVSQLLGTTGNTGASGINIDNQNVWTANNRYYVWDGSQNKYVDITTQIKGKSISSGGKGSYGDANGGGFR